MYSYWNSTILAGMGGTMFWNFNAWLLNPQVFLIHFSALIFFTYELRTVSYITTVYFKHNLFNLNISNKTCYFKMPSIS